MFPLVVFQTSTAWALPEDDLRMTAWSRSLIEHMHSLNKEKGLSSEFLYMGDAGEFQNTFSTFPPSNVERLKTIRAEYDPDKVFQRLDWGDSSSGSDPLGDLQSPRAVSPSRSNGGRK